MNAKLLFVSTLALALASTYAMADDTTPVTRAHVLAEYNQSVADHTLRKTDYDGDAHEYGVASNQTRASVLADMAATRKANTLIGPLRNRTYNPYGSDLQHPASMTRNEVKASVVDAMHDGSLRHSDYDGVPITVARRAVHRPTTTSVLAAG